MTRFWDGQTDGRTDGRSHCTPRPAFAFGDAGKKLWREKTLNVVIVFSIITDKSLFIVAIM